MPLVRIGVRAGETLSKAWGLIKQRATLAGDPKRVRAGDRKEDLERLVAMRKGSRINLPEMIDMDSYRIMKNELTVGQFRQFIEEAGYNIEGHGVNELQTLLKEGKDSTSLINTGLWDIRTYANWLSEKTGRKFRVASREEIEEWREIVGDRRRFLVDPGDELIKLDGPDTRYKNIPVLALLVEDK